MEFSSKTDCLWGEIKERSKVRYGTLNPALRRHCSVAFVGNSEVLRILSAGGCLRSIFGVQVDELILKLTKEHHKGEIQKSAAR